MNYAGYACSLSRLIGYLLIGVVAGLALAITPAAG
jgi:hypothetical protein